MKNLALWIWLAQKCGAGNAEMAALVERMGSIENVYEADFDTYTDEGASERLAEDLCDKRLDDANQIIAFCQARKIGILCYDDPRYPLALRSISNPPAVLYYQGILPDFNKGLFVSIVGTRKMSEYGMGAAYKIAYEVASSGAFVVSGMALGIDGVAAAASIEAGGRTVAVLGCGVDEIYPKEHGILKEKIRQNGVILSEFAPGTEPRGSHFPIRNRIISGLSQATVVVDADIGSGAMITAKCAILQGRDIYAVPSNIGSVNSSGTNSLIRDGAQAVLCGKDIVKNYTFAYKDRLNLSRMYASEERSALDVSVLTRLGMRLAKDFAPKAEMPKQEAKPRVHKSAAPDKKPEGGAKPETVKQESAYERAIMANGKPWEKETDNSQAALASLGEKQRLVFDEIPLDFPVTVDRLTTHTGLKLGEVMSALTVLEIKGLVVSLPGAIYMRK